MAKDKLDVLYDALSADGADVGTREQFKSYMLKPGDEGYQNRLKFYNAMKQDGADVGESYEVFRDWVFGKGKAKPQQQKMAPPKEQTDTAAKFRRAQSMPIEEKPDTATKFKAAQEGKPITTPFKHTKDKDMAVAELVGRGKQLENQWQQQSEHNKSYIGQRMGKMPGGVQDRLQVGAREEKTLVNNPGVVRGADRVNPETGQLEATYQNELGTYEGPGALSSAQFEQKQMDDARKYEANPLQWNIDDAYAEQRRIDEAIAARTAELDAEDAAEEESKGIGQRIAEGLARAESGPSGLNTSFARRFNDPELAMLWAAKRANDRRISTLERERNNTGFWSTFLDEATDLNTWDFGLQELSDAATMAAFGEKDIDKDTDMGKAQERMRQATVKANATDQQYGENDTFWQRAGSITAQALPFVAEFIATGGMSGIVQGGEKVGTKLAAKYATGKVGQWMLKNLGVLGGDLLGAFALANTTGSLKTAADIMERHQGNLVQNMDGSYSFEDGKSLGRAFYEGEVANTLEYYTEMLGNHLDGLFGKVAGTKAGKAMGLESLSRFLNRISGNTYVKVTNEILKRGGVHEYPSEVIEEEVNLLLNAMLVGDNNFSTEPLQQLANKFGANYSVDTKSDEYKRSIFNPKTQADILGGMLFSIGVMQSPGFVAGGTSKTYNTAQYYRYKHKLDVSGQLASTSFGYNNKGEAWEQLKGQIDNATNDELPDIIGSIFSNNELSTQQKKAAFDYVGNLLQMRGYNMGSWLAAKKEAEDSDETGGAPTADAGTGEAYANGYNADGEQRSEIKRNSDGLRDAVAQWLGEEGLANAEQDPEGMLEQVMNGDWSEAQKQQFKDYIESLTAYDGVIARVNDDIDTAINEANERISVQTNVDTGMIHHGKLVDESDVYIIGGTVVTDNDGNIDVTQSTPDIIVLDSDGNKRYINISQLAEVEAPVNPDELREETINNIRQQMGQAAANEIDGALPFAVGDVYTLPYKGTEHTFKVVEQIDDATVAVLVDGAQEPTPMAKEQLQGMADEAAHVVIPPAPATDITEQTGDTEEPGDTGEGSNGNVIANVEEDEQDDEEEELSAIEKAHRELYSDPDMTVEDNDQLVLNNIKKSTKAVQKAEAANNKPIEETDREKFKAERMRRRQALEQAQAELAYWQGIKDVQDSIVRAERERAAAEQAERERIAHEKAVAEAQAEEAARKAAEQEQRQRGPGAAHPAIREKWDAAPKIEGNADEIVLPNGERMSGRYVLVESGAATPSHDPNNEFAKNEGYPVDENGNTVNDRDYERDKDAQTITREMGRTYDSRALQDVPVVSREGVVLSGNGRTMAGQIAAQGNTDGAYIDYLKNYGGKFGFSAEQVGSMQHPRVVFVPDADMPYNTATFAKFNEQEKKGMTVTELAVKLGKTVPDDVFRRILQVMNEFDTLGDFYGNTRAATGVINELRNAGVIGANEYGQMFDGDTISERGKEMIEAMLIGKAFESNPDAIRQLTEFKSLRQSIVSALSEIVNNVALGDEYSLSEELSAAIDLCYKARKAGIQAGKPVSGFAKQGVIQFPGADATVADYTNMSVMMLADAINDNRVTWLRRVLSKYNEEASYASEGGIELWSGTREEKAEIINKVIDYLSNEQNKGKETGAAAQPEAESVQQTGDTGTGVGQGEQGGEVEANEKTQVDDTAQQPESVAKGTVPDVTEKKNAPKVRGRKQVEKALANAKKSFAEATAIAENADENLLDALKEDSTADKETKKKAEKLQKAILETINHIYTAVMNARLGDEGAMTEEENAWVDEVMTGLTQLGYSTAEWIAEGKPYNEGMRDEADFVNDETLPEGTQVIRSVRRPLILKDGVMVQSAKIVVAQNLPEESGQGTAPANETTAGGTETSEEELKPAPVEAANDNNEGERAVALFNETEVGDVYVNDSGMRAVVDKKAGKDKNRAVRVQWTQEVENGQNGRGQHIFSAINFLRWLEANRLEKQPKQPESAPEPSGYGSDNTLVSNARYEELKKRMRNKLRGQMNMGIDPEILAIGTEMAVYHIEAGARKFADFAKRMIEDMGDAIRPYLKSFYNAVRDLPEADSAGLTAQMDGYDDVRRFDVANFDKPTVDALAAAEQIVAEQTAEKQAEEAKEQIKEKRKNAESQQKKSKKSGKSQEKAVTSQREPSLFGDLFDEQEEENDNEKSDVQSSPAEGRGERHDQEPNGALGEGPESETPRPDGRGVGGRDRAHTGSDTGGSAGLSGLASGEPDVAPAPEQKRNHNNNRAERGKDYAPKDVDARIAANIAAIELMQKLIESGRPATAKEKTVLRKFSGWGGLGKAFNESAYGWRNDAPPTRIRQLLGDEGYEQANMSRNSAYFTPAKVIDALWDIARSLGFKGGKVLEGSAGIGNILGLMPQDMSERSDIQAIEIDSTTGSILSLLYPDAKVDIQGFEQTRIPNGSVDLAITNVPFVTGLHVKDETGDGDLSRKFRDIHDFCIAKNIRKLREGGIGIFITSSGTLDNSQKLRDWITSDGNADVVGAFRLNNDTFGGTGTTSDIIVVRKRVNGKKSAHAIDVSRVTGERSVTYDTGETKKVKGQYVPVTRQLSMDYNEYFVEHPEMMGGVMAFGFEKGDTYRPTSRGLFPKRGINQEQRLADFVNSFAGKEWDEVTTPTTDSASDYVYDELGEGVKEGSMLIDSKGNLCVATYGQAVPLDVNENKIKGHTKQECFRSYTAIKDAVNAVLKYQTEHTDDAGLQPLLDNLNKVFDDFVETYGHFNAISGKPLAVSFLRNDVDFSSVAALEKKEEYNDADGKRAARYKKSDIFSKRVVEKESQPKPTTVKDGVITSIYKYGRIDIPYISEQLGISEGDVKRSIIDGGYGYENPTSREVEVSYEYLSGNVREKLQQAREANTNGEYDANIKALEAVIPMDIPAHLIEFTLGSSWLDPQIYVDYIKDRTGLNVTIANVGGTWIVNAPYYISNEQNRSMSIESEKCDKIIWGHELITAALQNKTIRVTKSVTRGYGLSRKTETIVDNEASAACAAKIDEIRQDFKDWARDKIQNDPALGERIEREYNERFNNYVAKEIPDSFVPEYFSGASHSIHLRTHQAKAAVRATTEPLMLAHEVGTGKTMTLITTAMEMRRLGTARKPMIVVQNSTLGQFVASAKRLYPNAKILALDDSDRNAEGRKAFYAKIKYNDWDMIVIPQSTFEMIPDSEERQIAFVKDKIQEKMYVLEQMRESGAQDGDIKRAERELDKMGEELAEITKTVSEKRKERDAKKEAIAKQNASVKAREMLDRKVDEVENFDEMGIDAIIVDEAHEYKHLGFATAMQRGVKGVDPSYSKKSQGVFLKCQSVLERTGGKNVVFATGTPISNTAAEIWTFMRYLMPADMMREYGIYYFDDFVRNFGNLTQMLEFSTSGKFKEVNRFAGYVNLPELVRIWSSVSDTVLTDDASDLKDKIPELEGGKATDLYLPQTRALRSVMKYVKAELKRFEDMSGKEKKANSHIPLTMYGIAKAAAVDARLVLSDAEDEPNSKTNEAVRQTLRSLEETADYKGTVAIFSDTYQNKESGFNLYEDIRKKLIAAGVPAEQIVVMKSGMTSKKKLDIFDKVKAGEIRVILGSTFTLGTGVNIQERLHTLIHLDAPNRPMDYTQRNGRILRQGNIHKQMGKPIRILRFGVEDSLDVTAYQRLKTKGAIADSIMHGRQLMSDSMDNRTMEEEEDVFGDTVAQLSGSEYAMLKQQAEREVRKYRAKQKQHDADQIYIHNQKPRLLGQIAASRKNIESCERGLEKLKDADMSRGITIGKKHFTDADAMGEFFKEYNKRINEIAERIRGSYMDEHGKSELTVNIGGFDFVFTTELSKQTERVSGTLKTVVRREMSYTCDALGLNGVPVERALLRNGVDDIIQNVLTGNDLRERMEISRNSIARNEEQLAMMSEREGKPFEFADELAAAEARLEDYTAKMKAEMAEKEAKYAEVDADIDAATDVVAPEEEDEEESDENMYREDDEEKTQRSKKNLLEDLDIPEIIATFVPSDNMNNLAEPIGILENDDAVEWAERHKEALVQRCLELAFPSNTLDPDAVRDIFQLIGYNGRNVPEYKAAGNIIVAEMFKRMMADAVASGNPTITFMSGIGGAGKGTTLKRGGIDTSGRGVVYDAAFNDMEKLLNKMKEAAAVGMTDIEVIVVHNDGLTAFKNTIKRGKSKGRFLGINYFLESYEERDGLVQYISENARDLGVNVTIVPLDNAGNDGRGKISIEQAISEWDYDPTHYIEEILNYLNDEIQSGRLTENQITSVAGDISKLKEEWTTPAVRRLAERIDERVRESSERASRGEVPGPIGLGVEESDAPSADEGGSRERSSREAIRTRKIYKVSERSKSRRVRDYVTGLWRTIESDDSDYRIEGMPGTYRGYEAALEAWRKYSPGNWTLSDDGMTILLAPRVVGNPMTAKERKAADTWRKTVRENGRAKIADLNQRLGIEFVIVDDLSNAEYNKLSKRKQRAKGWYDRRSRKLYIQLDAHGTSADIVRTILHEAVAHKGLRELFGEDFDTFLDNVYANADAGIRREIARMAVEEYGGNFRVATEEYLARLAEVTDFDSPKYRNLWDDVKSFFLDLLRKAGVRLSKPLTDSDLRYILWRSFNRMEEQGVLGAAEDIVMREKLGIDSDANEEMFRDPDDGTDDDGEDYENEDYDAGQYTFEESITNGMLRAASNNHAALSTRVNAMRALGGNLMKLRQAMAQQRQYDRGTVDSIVRLAKMVMDSGFFQNMSRYEVKRLMGMINRAAGREDITKQAGQVVDLLLKHQLKECATLLQKQISVRGSKINAKGVEVQGQLDLDGQRMVKAMKDAMSLDADALNQRISETLDRMGSDDEALAANAAVEYQGLLLAKQYLEDIKQSEAEESVMRQDLKQAKEDYRAGNISREAYKQFVSSTEDAIRQNRLERIEAYNRLAVNLGSGLRASIDNASQWREKERQRVNEIHHNANSDLQGVPADEHRKLSWMQRAANWSFVRFFMKPLATFDMMLRYFGSNSVDGRGYLWNRFMGGWNDANEREYRNLREAHKELDDKVSTVMGKKMRWSDLFAMERKMPTIDVEFWNGDEMQTYQLNQGNMLYIYMVNKMSDGRMKLRRMGITEEVVDAITDKIDPRFIALADWIQDEFLKNKRNEYNAVHERLFGASMAAIENYFPLKINSRSRGQEEEIGEPTYGETRPSTITGSIIKRTRNSLPLDVTGADAFDVVLEHLQNMEHWAAFAELNHDMNTLLSYRRFRNRVLNMSSARYGAGKTLWKNFKDVCAIAAGVYTPKTDWDSVDTTLINAAKGVTAAKIAFRPYTALKQLLSSPAYISEANLLRLLKNNPLTGGVSAWNWAMEELPGFYKRWHSRQAGDSRLRESDVDWGLWKNKIVSAASRFGMSPNAFIDGLTVACGARAIYQTKLARYKKAGFSEEEAKRRALRDASISFNETQQSNENAYLSTMQLDRTVASVALTIFRNASMGYQRKMLNALDNLNRKLRPGYRETSIEFMRKQLVREGLSEENALRTAKRMYNRSWLEDISNVAIFGFVLQFAWNLGPYLPYLLMGDDDDKKGGMLEDAAMHALAGGVEGLSGGNVMSDIYNLKRSGGDISNYNFNLLPLMSDIQTTMRHYKYDEVSAWNDVVNILVQSGVGVNPQTFTDMFVAIADACNGDPKTSREVAMLIMRIMNVPQSQLDELYIDELGVTARDALKLDAGQLAKRYARYKMYRSAPLTSWAYGDDEKGKVEDRYVKGFENMMKERLSELDDAGLESNYDTNDEMRRKDISNQLKKSIDADVMGDIEPVSKEQPGYRKFYDANNRFVDISEDYLIDSHKRLAAADGDAKRAYALEYIDKYILTYVMSGKPTVKPELKDDTREKLGKYADFVQKLKNEKHEREVGLNGFGNDNDDAVFQLLRDLRKEVLEEFEISR